MTEREKIVHNYIAAYNRFDVDQMLWNMDEDILFENISNGAISLSTKGLQAFREQAEQASSYFTEREQTITSLKENGEEVEIAIDYEAVPAMDFPNGLKKGEPFHLQGRFVDNLDRINGLAESSEGFQDSNSPLFLLQYWEI